MLEIHSLELSRDPPFRMPKKAIHGEISHCAAKPHEEGLLAKPLATMHSRIWMQKTAHATGACQGNSPEPGENFFPLVSLQHLLLTNIVLAGKVKYLQGPDPLSQNKQKECIWSRKATN